MNQVIFDDLYGTVHVNSNIDDDYTEILMMLYNGDLKSAQYTINNSGSMDEPSLTMHIADPAVFTELYQNIKTSNVVLRRTHYDDFDPNFERANEYFWLISGTITERYEDGKKISDYVIQGASFSDVLNEVRTCPTKLWDASTWHLTQDAETGVWSHPDWLGQCIVSGELDPFDNWYPQLTRQLLQGMLPYMTADDLSGSFQYEAGLRFRGISHIYTSSDPSNMNSGADVYVVDVNYKQDESVLYDVTMDAVNHATILKPYMDIYSSSFLLYWTDTEFSRIDFNQMEPYISYKKHGINKAGMKYAIPYNDANYHYYWIYWDTEPFHLPVGTNMWAGEEKYCLDGNNSSITGPQARFGIEHIYGSWANTGVFEFDISDNDNDVIGGIDAIIGNRIELVNFNDPFLGISGVTKSFYVTEKTETLEGNKYTFDISLTDVDKISEPSKGIYEQ